MKLHLVPLTMAVALSMFAAQARAATIPYELNFVYTGNLPDSTTPYLNATFRDAGDCTAQSGAGGDCTVGTVELVLTSSLEDPDEFFSNFFFNSSTAVTTSYTSLLAGAIGSAPLINQYSSNAYAAAGQGGSYDVRIDFDIAPPADRFNLNDSLLFTITGTGITANTFLVSALGSSYFAAAHLQGITGGCSAWVVDANGATPGGAGSAPGVTPCTQQVPDSGSTLALLGVAMMGLGYLRSRRM